MCYSDSSSAWAEALTHPPRTESVGQTGTCVVLSHQDLGLLDTAIQDSTTSISHHYLLPLRNAHEVLLLLPDPREDTLPTFMILLHPSPQGLPSPCRQTSLPALTNDHHPKDEWTKAPASVLFAPCPWVLELCSCHDSDIVLGAGELGEEEGHPCY